MPTLFVVATPIGNLGDLTPRAREALAEAERVFAEDTRRTRALLAYAGIEHKPVVRVDAHAPPERVARLVEGLAADAKVALVTDAGVPGVSDPGAALVRAASAAGVRVVPIPGASALTAAIAASGLVEGPFTFLAFLPRHGKKRRVVLERIAAASEAIVLFESPQRITETLRDLAPATPGRRAALCRELTKLHEEILYGTLEELAALEREWLGELTLVLGPQVVAREREEEAAPAELDAEIAGRLAKGAHPKDLATELAARLAVPRRTAYARVLAVKGAS
ncbi:MAG TPA: 16S rRNA (cytidine(1402)-2'-O)-methyltransferase [Polyangiaceae bacterium]|jgi:16S rRNA (cytidine1402-2'-O)-methyltransferase|nr:16S rRNA (cytidine(1402)-2'-O)-methyltransferase [Polyangiaceae bacterium]